MVTCLLRSSGPILSLCQHDGCPTAAHAVYFVLASRGGSADFFSSLLLPVSQPRQFVRMDKEEGGIGHYVEVA